MLEQNAFDLLLELGVRRIKYLAYANYYDGKHPLMFASEKFWNAFGPMFQAFADNLCPSVVDACADRLILTGFSADGEDKAAATAAWEVWRDNRMDQRAAEVHTEALIAGDGYVIVWPGEDSKPTIYPNCGADVNVQFETGTPGRITLAIKSWVEGKKVRLNVYRSDRIEKWVSRNETETLPTRVEQFEEYKNKAEPWPLPNPYEQVPVFHFGNNARVGKHGKSELCDVIPIQNALNKSVADMLVGMEFTAWPQRWVAGLEVKINPEDGKPIKPWEPGVDRIWTTPTPDTKFGQFDPANLEQFIRVQDAFRLEIARVSRTPLHYLMPTTGQFPSGESLKTAEAPFTSKVKRRQVAFGNVWEDVLRFALKIKSQSAPSRLSAQWEDPTPRSETDQVDIAQGKSALGVSNDQLQRELGYSEEQIKKMKQEKADYQPTGLDELTRRLKELNKARGVGGLEST